MANRASTLDWTAIVISLIALALSAIAIHNEGRAHLHFELNRLDDPISTQSSRNQRLRSDFYVLELVNTAPSAATIDSFCVCAESQCFLHPNADVSMDSWRDTIRLVFGEISTDKERIGFNWPHLSQPIGPGAKRHVIHMPRTVQGISLAEEISAEVRYRSPLGWSSIAKWNSVPQGKCRTDA